MYLSQSLLPAGGGRFPARGNSAPKKYEVGLKIQKKRGINYNIHKYYVFNPLSMG
jgi:hypothetical protein